MRQFVILVLAATIVGCPARESSDSPEQLADALIAAVKQKDAAQFKRLIHPACMEGLSEPERKYLELAVQNSLKEQIPEERTVRVFEVKNWSPPSDANAWRWPVKPTHQIEIAASTGEYSSVSICQYIAKQGDRWLVVMPIPDPKTLEELERQSAPRQPDGTRPR
ncbi:MAG: hypothetical protein RDV41_00665 [Planctomycetota bacterium]|nr:hypothetical protein [Planctomycetota bacterium]